MLQNITVLRFVHLFAFTTGNVLSTRSVTRPNTQSGRAFATRVETSCGGTH